MYLLKESIPAERPGHQPPPARHCQDLKREELKRENLKREIKKEDHEKGREAEVSERGLPLGLGVL